MSQPPVWLVLLAFVCALGPLVFFHELGHYLVARLFRVPAEAFSIGFGHEVAGWTDKQGTRWKIGWLPLGGYVKFVGDMGPSSESADESAIPPDLRGRAFQFKPVWQRFLIVLAGPATNFLLAIVIFAGFFSIVGAPSSNIVGKIEPNSAAAAAGIRAGDRILSVAGRDTPTFDDVRSVVSLRPNEPVTIRVERDGSIANVRVTLKSDKLDEPGNKDLRKGLLGVYPTETVLEPMPVTRALPAAIDYTWRLTVSIVDGIRQIVTGRIPAAAIGGPITIAQVAGEGAALGPLPFIALIALLSINLGFINLLPVPMLDGGHLFFYVVEAVRRRPVSARALEWSFRGGLAVILALLVFTTINDLGSLGLWDRLQRLIG